MSAALRIVSIGFRFSLRVQKVLSASVSERLPPTGEFFGDGMINHLNKLGSLGNGAVWLLYLSSFIGVTYRAKMSDSEKHKGCGYNAKSYPTTNLK